MPYVHSKYSRRNTRQLPSSHWLLEKEGGFLLADFQFGASPPALKAARAALCVFKMWRHLHCAHFQCDSSCSVYIMEADGKIKNENWSWTPMCLEQLLFKTH
jgi:hypothetical protein